MGCLTKLANAVLFLFFLLMALISPFLDAQFCLPIKYQPKFMLDFSSWANIALGDYLFIEKPNFYVGFAWMELCISWPLAIVNLFGMIYSKSWFKTTCLIHGVMLTTSLVAILSELIGSGKAPEKLKMIYYVLMGIAVLILLRGLLSSFFDSPISGKRPLLAARKKRA